MAAQVALHVGTEAANVCDASSIHRLLAALFKLGIPLVNLSAFFGEVFIEQVETMQALAFVAAEKMHALLIQK